MLTPETTLRRGLRLPFTGRAGSYLLLRGILLVLLLLAELIALSIRFDSASLTSVPDGWAVAMLQVPWLARLGLVMATATLLFTALRSRGTLRDSSRSVPREGGLFLVAHFLALSGFTWLTAQILEGNVRRGSHPELWALAWAAAGLATVLFWLAAVISPRDWPALFRSHWPALLAAAGVGAAVSVMSPLGVFLWQWLGRGTLVVAAFLLRLFTADVICRPGESVLGTSTFLVEVAPSCSGYEGMALIVVFLTAYLWLFRHELRFPQALLLVPLGAGVIWLANAARITALILVGTWWSPSVALGGFHSQAGWLAFNAVAVGLVIASRRARLFRTMDSASEETRSASPTAAYLMPLLVLVATQMIATALTDGFDYLLPLKVVAVAATLWIYRRQYGELRTAVSWEAFALGGVGFVVWVALARLQPAVQASPLPAHLSGLPAGWAVAWLTFRVVSSVVLVPLAEELAFRGYALRRLIAADFLNVSPRRFTLLSFTVSSLLFGALHGYWLAGTICGMLFALAVHRRGRLLDAVVAHAVANALIAACVLLGGAWYLW